jgi:hypothetical protein
MPGSSDLLSSSDQELNIDFTCLFYSAPKERPLAKFYILLTLLHVFSGSCASTGTIVIPTLHILMAATLLVWMVRN